MRSFGIIPFGIVLFLITASGHAQTLPHSLLWKISGNGFTKPCYLYGTFHLSDKRLFNFGDSVYAAIAASNGFALEVNPDSMTAMAIAAMKLIQQSEESSDDDEQAKNAIKMLERRLHKSIKNITMKDLRKLFNAMKKASAQSESMDTFMDGFLYSLARKQGKMITGIEDPEDQLQLLGRNEDEDDVFDRIASKVTDRDAMIGIYLDQDIEKLLSFIQKRSTKEYVRVLLTDRNVKMARRMDSLGRLNTWFFAVGSGHLAGDSGVIMLLRQRGFTVEPVYSHQRIKADDYVVSGAGLQWKSFSDPDSLYTASMPGTPSRFPTETGLNLMLLYDAGTGMVYYSGVRAPTAFTQQSNNDEMLDAAVTAITMKGGEILNRSEITLDSSHGIEVLIHMKSLFLRGRFLISDSYVFIAMAGGAQKAHTKSADCETFMQSFKPNFEAIANQRRWDTRTIGHIPVSLLAPGTLRSEPTQRSVDSSSFSTNSSFYDRINKISISVQVSTAAPGYLFTNDSIRLVNQKNSASKRPYKSGVQEQIFRFRDQYPAYRYSGYDSKSATLLKVLYFRNGSTSFYLECQGPNNSTNDSLIEACFNSIAFKQPQYDATWIRSAPPDTTWSAIVPRVDFTRSKLSENNGPGVTKPGTRFMFFDSTTARSWYIDKQAISPLYWCTNDSLFYYSHAPNINFEQLVSTTRTTNSGYRGMEFVFMDSGRDLRLKIRLFMCGDTLFTLLGYLTAQELADSRYSRFFNDFTPSSSRAVSTVFDNKIEGFFQALNTDNTLAFNEAFALLKDLKFSPSDVPRLHSELLKPHSDSTAYINSNLRLARIIARLGDSSSVAFLANAIQTIPANKTAYHNYILSALMQIQTSESYNQLKEIFRNKSWCSIDPDIGLTYLLYDSLSLSAHLYPEFGQLCSNDAWWEYSANLTSLLLDKQLLDKDKLLSFRQAVFYRADRILQHAKAEEPKQVPTASIVETLGYIPGDSSEALLRRFLTYSDTDIRCAAVASLAALDKPVSPSIINTLVSNPSTRLVLYKYLKKHDKLDLIPEQFRTRVKLAESELLQTLSQTAEEDGVRFECTPIGLRVWEFHGVKQTFYQFTVRKLYRNKLQSEYFGIAGPYSMDANDMTTDNSATGVYWDEAYAQGSTYYLFKKLIEGFE